MEISTFNKMIKLSRTVFGLPVTVGGGLLALVLDKPQCTLLTWVWIVLGFSAARTAGMAFNELIDRSIDAKNPRTKERVLPSHQARPAEAALIAWVSLLAFNLICLFIGPAVFYCSLVASVLIWGYAYTKRFTPLCHLVLGLIEGLGPVMAYAAVANTITPAVILIGVAKLCSLAAADIVYAVQDLEFDRAHGLYSIPSMVGEKGSFLIAKILHLVCIAALTFAGLVSNLPVIYFVGIGGLAGLFIVFHRRASLDPMRSFFAANSSMAVMVFASIVGSYLWRVLL